MGEDEGTPIAATVEQTENPVDYVNSEQLEPIDTPPTQEIVEPTLSASIADGSVDVQINAEASALPVTASAEPDSDKVALADNSANSATTITTTEDTMTEEVTTASDIAAKVETIQEQSVNFEEKFDLAHAVHDDLLKQILDLMEQRTLLLTTLRDSLQSVNTHLAKFNAAKVDM